MEPEAGMIGSLAMAAATLLSIALVAGTTLLFDGRARRASRLTRDRADRERVADALEAPKGGRIYLNLLDGALKGLDRLMGPVNLEAGAFQGLSFCLLLGVVYAPLFLVFGWALFDASGRIGPLEPLPDWSSGVRALSALFVCLSVLAVLLVARRTLEGGLVVAGVVPAAAIATAGAEAAVVAAAPAVAAIIIARAGAMVAEAAIIMVSAVGVGVAFTGALGRFSEAGFFILLVCVALPFANFAPDAASWWVGRGLGRRAHTVLGGGRPLAWQLASLVALALLGLVAAVLLFGLTAWFLPRLANAVNAFAGWAGTDLALTLKGPDGLVCRAARDPWGEGAWPTLMLLTTLAPSALHLGMAALSPIASWWLKWFHDPDLAARLRAISTDDTEADGPVAPVIRDAASRLAWAWFGAILTFAALLMLAWLAFDSIGPALPWLNQALQMITRATLWAASGLDSAAVEACLGAP